MPPDEPQEPSTLALAADFPAPTREQWRELVAAVLAKSGRDDVDPEEAVDPEDALSYTTYDGIRIRPLYTAEDAHALDVDGLPGHPPFVRGSTADGAVATGWDVRTRHADPDPARTNAAVLADLERGATSLWLVLGDAGLALDDLGTALDGVYLDLVPIALDAADAGGPGDAGARPDRAVQALLGVAERHGTDPAELRGTAGADPIGARARTGAAADLAVLGELADITRAAPQLRLATIDATVYHDAGASDAQELGIATAVGVAYLRALTDAGRSVDAALAALEFRYAVTAEQFPSIAKLRAARRIWDRVAELSRGASGHSAELSRGASGHSAELSRGASGHSAELSGASAERRGQYQHAVTSAAMLTRRDPWVNMLRTTIGCFAAAVGGADAITVLPFDSAIGLSDDFGRRIARNTHAVLHDESSLARVIDAAGGSWFVESLTDQLADKAWDVFTSIERAGGALAALDGGTIGDLLAATRAQRDADIAHRRAPITGVSEFAYVGEQPVVRPPAPHQPASGPLTAARYADGYESLRDRADAAPQRPRVFLAALGTAAQHSARLGFATNLFAAGGIECVVGPVDEFVAAGTQVACLCSSDKVYADEAEPAAKALRDAGATRIWLAGTGDVDGVDGTLYAGCDALAVLRTTLADLEAPR